MYTQTGLLRADERLAWMTRPVAEFRNSTDPFIRLAVRLHDTGMALEERRKKTMAICHA
jgi:hypothetical protein